MSSRTDSGLITLGHAAHGPESSAESGRESAAPELALARAVAAGEPSALRSSAERMCPRVARVARAVMGDSVDAQDAAQHALLDLLRALPSYRGRARFERWVDRAAAVSVLRFARAVRRRDGAAVSLTTRELPVLSQKADPRTLAQYLMLLRPETREVLLLRHALGFPLGRLADALQSSLPVVKEQLLAARRDLRGLARRRAKLGAPGPGAQRWCALRDREAVGELLTPEELSELEQLEARDPEVWLFVTQVRALELYFDPARESEPPAAWEPALVERALVALQVTAPAARLAAEASEAELERALEPAGSRLVRGLALGASLTLAAASAIALFLYQPSGRRERSAAAPLATAARDARPPAQGSDEGAPLPVVETMTRARASRRGARLRSGNRLLPERAIVRQGELIESMERPGCLELAPDLEAWLAPYAALRLTALRNHEQQLELVRGRAVFRPGPKALEGRLLVRTGELTVSAQGATFAIERSADGTLIRARALRSEIEVRVGEVSQSISEGRAVLYRASERAIRSVALLPAMAQRDWNVLSAGPLAAPSGAHGTPAVDDLPAGAGPGSGLLRPKAGSSVGAGDPHTRDEAETSMPGRASGQGSAAQRPAYDPPEQSETVPEPSPEDGQQPDDRAGATDPQVRDEGR